MAKNSLIKKKKILVKTRGRYRYGREGKKLAKNLESCSYYEFFTDEKEIAFLILKYPKIQFTYIRAKDFDTQVWSMRYYDFDMNIAKYKKIK